MPSSTFHDLLEACRKPGCVACRLEVRALEKYIDNLFYESVNDVKTRECLRASLGFCREHARLAVDRRLGNALGFAIIYQDVITNLLMGLEKDTVIHAITPHRHCVVCQHQEKTLHRIISALAEGLTEPQMVKALRTSDGLCVPHMKKVLEAVHEPASVNLLLSIQREKLEGLRDELTEFIRKNDYRFKDEGFGPEGDSWRRAIRKLTGDITGEQET